MPTKFLNLKHREFCSIFRAEEEVRLSTYDDDKRKSGKIILFQAGSYWYPMLLKTTDEPDMPENKYFMHISSSRKPKKY